MVIKNTTTYGAQLTSLGDGSDSSFWRQGGAWSSGTPTNAGISIGTTFSGNPQLATAGVGGAGAGIISGFLTYLVIYNFGATGAAQPATGLFVGLSINGSSSQIYDYQIGTLEAAGQQFSGAYIYQPGSIQPFYINLLAKTVTGTATLAFGSITVIGIN